MAQEPKDPLYDTHVKNGGRIVDFGGWALPVQFTGIKEEHNACRTKALWDVSNMGELLVQGKEALDLLQMLLVNDVSNSTRVNHLFAHVLPSWRYCRRSAGDVSG